MENIVSIGFEVLQSSLIAIFLYILPGLALLAWFWKGNPLRWSEKVGLASGISIAIYPILFLWSYLMGLSPGRVFAWAPGILAIFALVWKHRKTVKKSPAFGRKTDSSRALKIGSYSLVFSLVVVLLLVTRITAVHDMTAPAWGDSVHHTMIVQLIVDNGGLFQSWEPYAPISSFTYHFGFHSLAAVWAWVSGLAAPKAVIVAGQVMNVLAILALYSLAVRLTGSRWAGIAAMIVAGLLSPIPAFYMNWGRYPQLTSQIILPVAFWFFDEWWSEAERPSIWTLLLIFILFAGVALIHYSIAFVVGLGAISWALWGLWQLRKRLKDWLIRMGEICGASILSALSVFPWALIVLKGRIPLVFKRMAVAEEESYITGDVAIWKNTDAYFSDLFWIFGLVALILALRKRPRLVFPVMIWCLLSFLLTNPYLLGVRGPGWITNFALIIALYIPIGLTLGWLIGKLWDDLSPFQSGRILVIVSLLLLLGLGTRTQLRIVDPFFQTVEPNDREVFDWIRANVPKEARFLVNGFLVFDETTVVGSDAGWWLPYYTLRENTVPPVLYTLERGIPSVDRYSFRRIALEIRESRGEAARLREVLCREGISHVFLGERRGTVGYGAKELVPEAWLSSNRDFELVHQKGKTQVWSFDRSLCAQTSDKVSEPRKRD